MPTESKQPRRADLGGLLDRFLVLDQVLGEIARLDAETLNTVRKHSGPRSGLTKKTTRGGAFKAPFWLLIYRSQGWLGGGLDRDPAILSALENQGANVLLRADREDMCLSPLHIRMLADHRHTVEKALLIAAADSTRPEPADRLRARL